MAETSDDIRNDIALTRNRMSSTLTALERKVNPQKLLEDHPLTGVAVAFGAGALLGGMGTDGRTVREAKKVVRTASTQGGTALDRILSSAIGAATATAGARLNQWLDQVSGQAGGAGSQVGGNGVGSNGSRALTGQTGI